MRVTRKEERARFRLGHRAVKALSSDQHDTSTQKVHDIS